MSDEPVALSLTDDDPYIDDDESTNDFVSLTLRFSEPGNSEPLNFIYNASICLSYSQAILSKVNLVGIWV